MDFILMLTRNDRTLEDCLDILDIITETGVRHIVFKDIGVDRETQAALVERIKEIGATSYMEVVSTTSETARASIKTAVELGVERVLGGQEVSYALNILKDSGVGYYPFPGTPVGHPTKLAGRAEDIAADCRHARAAGCLGADLLAYRATDSDPLELVRAARDALGSRTLIVAGSINSRERIRALAGAGADAFTIGSAVFDGSFSPTKGSIVSQCKDILQACNPPD